MELLGTIWYWTVVAIKVLMFLGLSIFVHELGHFLTARWCGMVVDTFSIGFGPAIWKTKRNGTVYKIGWIPCGGYVALPQLDPAGMEKIQGKAEDGSSGAGDVPESRDLPPAAPWHKILVSLAGATGNVILAILIAWLVYWQGIPAAATRHSAVIGYVKPDSSAFEQGLRTGDTVQSANDVRVKNWQDVQVEAALNDEVLLRVMSPDGVEKEATLVTERGEMDQQMIKSVFGYDPWVIGEVEKGSSAEAAGLRADDLILEFDGVPICGREQLIEIVSGNRDQTVPIKIERDGEELTMQVSPTFNEEIKRATIGISFKPQVTIIHPKPGEQLRNHATIIFKVLKALVTPKKAGNAARAVGGPVLIFKTYFTLVATSFMLAIWFTGLLNVNLAIINLLPIPILDGGHIVFAAYEGIFRRPMHPRVISALVNVFGVLIIGLFILILYRDVKRVVPVHSGVGRLFQRVDRVFGGEEMSPSPEEEPGE